MKMATRYLTRSLLAITKQNPFATFSRSHTTAPSAVLPNSSPFLFRIRPLVASASSSNSRRLAPALSTRGFASRQTASSLNDPNPNWSNRPPKETILLDGCDFEHWLVVMEKPENEPTRDEIIDSYIKTLAMVVGSEEEARMKIYSVSTRHYFAFGALVSEELSYKLKELPKVRWVLPDSYLDVRNKDYGGQVTNSHQQILGNVNSEDDNEVNRGSHTNKGRIPWNKGRRHSEETRQKIRQRTKEALKDPKVRKKMSECPRSLSNQTKARIQASLTKLWGKRLQWKRSKEKLLHSWAESIATAAKMGGSDQEELDWDSYDKITREMALQQLRQAEEIAKAKEIARVRAVRAAQLKAEKMAKIAERRREREENASVKGESVKKRNKRSKEEKEKLAEFQEVKLKERLMKIHRKKAILNQAINQQQRSWEKFDLDFVKGEQLPKEVTLADQIRFAKDRRTNQQLLN